MGPFKVWALADVSQNPFLDRTIELPRLPLNGRLPQFMDQADFYLDTYIGYSGTSLNDIVKNILTSGSGTTGNGTTIPYFETAVKPLIDIIKDISYNSLRGHWSEWYNDIPGQCAADEYIYLKYPDGLNEFTPDSLNMIKRAVNGALTDTTRFKENIKGALFRMTERMKSENATQIALRTSNVGAVYNIPADAARGIPIATTAHNLMKYEGFGYIITLSTTDPEAINAEQDVRIGIRFFEDAAGKMKWDGSY